MTRFLSASDVQMRYNVSRSTLYRWQIDSSVGLPPPMKIGHRILWRASDLDAFDASICSPQSDRVQSKPGDDSGSGN